ncbi:sensor histidine kinase [Paenibacillus tarimensis]
MMEYIMHSLDILIFLSIPQTYIFAWFAFLFWGIRTEHLFVRLLWFTVISSIYLDMTFLALPTHFHIINSLISFFFFLRLFFKELNLRVRLLIQICFYTAVILHDTLAYIIISQLIDVDLILRGPTIYKILFMWPAFAAVAMLCLLFQRKRYYPAKKIRQFLTDAKDTAILHFITLIFIQTLTLSLFMITNYYTGYKIAALVLFYICLVMIVVVTLMSVRLFVKTREEAIRMTQNVYVGDLMQMLTSIRGQRHDFMNHIQIISSMLSMKKYDQLKHYIEEVSAHIHATEDPNSRLPSSAIAALVQAKAMIAADKRINFNYELPECPKSLQSLKIIDLVRVAGNLIDNAFDEAGLLPERERHVRFSIAVNDGMMTIKVGNRGRALSEEEKRIMFTPGYTTKERAHSGLGLPIVLEIVKKYNGNITILSDEEYDVVFELVLPVNNKLETETA